MLIDVRLPGGERGVDGSMASTSAIMRALAEGRLNAAGTRVVCDWVQYRNNFRPPLSVRSVINPHARLRSEVAIDLRRVEPGSFSAELMRELAGHADDACYLEPWAPMSRSCIWRFNTLYWQELALWEEACGRGYAETLPGGGSGGTNLAATRAVLGQLFAVWDGLGERSSLPDQLTVLELGVGNGEQAKVWLDEFRRIDHERGSDYYRRLHYLMGDYSNHVLARARAAAIEHEAKLSTISLEAARPTETLRFLESKIFFVYISNVYDNLPTDELAVLDDTFYSVEARAFVPQADVRRVAEDLGARPERIAVLVERLLRLGPSLLAEAHPEQFPDTGSATAFWREIWSVLHMAERYVPLGPLDTYQVCDGITGDVLAPLIDGHGDIRFHVSNGAVASFVDTLPLLHPLGSLTCHDLFTTDLSQYHEGFRGPGKYDGSVVNWVNGPVMRAVAGRRHFQLDFSPLVESSRSAVLTATARRRD